MKKVYYYLVFQNTAEVDERYIDEYSNGELFVNGDDVVNQSRYYNSVEVAMAKREETIESSKGGYNNELWHYHTVSPVMEGWVNDYEKSYDE